MDETNIKKLNLRLMNFLRDTEEKDISFGDIKEFFSYSELMRILERSNFKKQLMDVLEKVGLPPDFQEIIDEKTRELFEDESIEEYCYLTSDEVLLECISKMKDSHPEDYIHFLKTDESRVKALSLRTVKKYSYRGEYIVSSFEDDNLKLKYLSLVTKDDIRHVLSTIKDDRLKMQLIDKYPSASSIVVSQLENEDMRIYYYEKYFRQLDEYGKRRIFLTLSEENQIKYLNRYWKSLTLEEKLGHLTTIKDQGEVLKKVEALSNFERIQLLERLGNEQKELASQIESTINYSNSRRIIKKISKEGIEHVIYKLNIDRLFAPINDRQKIKFVEYLSDSMALPILSTMKKFKNAEKYINHFDDLPHYEEKYDSLIIRYAKEYNLNPEHLIQIVKLSGLEILKNIRNENIQKLVNLDKESFKKLVGLFDIEKQKMDESTLNDNINIYLQRSFKLKFPDIINISSHIRLAVQNDAREQALALMDKIVSEYDISKILKKYNFTSDEFLKSLVLTTSPDEKTTSCLLEITNGYIVHKRNEYIKENIATYQRMFCHTDFDMKSAQKFIIENFPISILKKTIFNPKHITLASGCTQEEIDFVNHPTALESIINFRRNPSQFKGMPEEVKKYMKVFNKIFEEQFENRLVMGVINDSIKTVNSPKTYVNPDTIREVLFDLDAAALKDGIFINEELYQSLSDTLTRYKLFGFNETMRDTFSNVDLWTDSSTISSLIKYFPIIHADLKEKMDRGEIKNITLPALLDMAQCYSMDSNKLAIVFGRDNIRLISSNPGPNSSSWSKEKRIDKAQKYLKIMHERKHVSVPPCDENLDLPSGKQMNVVIGNVSDPINLTYGERTGACMRIGGHADSLFDFCLSNEHGFHIRFSSPDDDGFVSRVSGFRNGNTVFLNELRYSVDGRYSNEDVREACILAAQLLIEKSKDSTYPIENVVIAPEYVMSGSKTTPLNVSEIKKGVGNFYTDVRTENATVLATSNSDNSLVPIKLGNGGIQKYPVQRGKIRKYEGDKCLEHLDRIELVDQILSGKPIDETATKPKKDIALCYCGEDWYVTVDSKGNISEYVMENSHKKELANREKKECIRQIKEKLGYANEDTNTNSVGGVKR
ncbi:MAG: hypothetical protein E7162_05640 [Firmicutes bacterium]|nr:hypothetical protein [Bacillota bacterium]